MDTRFTSIMTIGLGMIGSSFVMAYRAAYPDSYIIGVDISQDTIDEAQERGWINEGLLATDDLSEALSRCDLVMIATPVPVVPDYFCLIAENDFAGVVTDTCSTKAIVSQKRFFLIQKSIFRVILWLVQKKAVLKQHVKIYFRVLIGFCVLMRQRLLKTMRICMKCLQVLVLAWCRFLEIPTMKW